MTFVACGDDDDNAGGGPDPAPSIADRYAGTYSGIDSMNVNMGSLNWGYKTAGNVPYILVAHDNMLRITFPEETYTDTQIGDITIGSYTIDSLTYNGTSFTRSYQHTSETVHFKSTGGTDYPVKLDNTYPFIDKRCQVTVTMQPDGTVLVNNSYVLRDSPVLITHTFSGSK